MRMRRFTTGKAGVLVTVLAILVLAVPAAAQSPEPELRPMVFVHGSSGSAIQFETHAMRFTSNGYPQRLLYAFEYDTSVPLSVNGEQVNDDLDAFIDMIRADTGAAQVDAAGHSRGTSVMHRYLSEADQAAKVAHYVNLDGRAAAAPPGGVPTLAVWGEWNPTSEIVGAINLHFDDKGHTEVATAAETFAAMYEFFTGAPPATSDVVPEPPGLVTVAGRATIFPFNVGAAGGTLDVYRVDDRTGARISRQPLASYPIDEAGAWGPVNVNGQKHYEFALTRPGGSVHHFYFQPFARSDHFIRLQTSIPGQGLEAFIPRGENHSSLVLVRNREWWADQPGHNDVLAIDGLNILTPAISPRARVNIAVFAFDSGPPYVPIGIPDGQTNLAVGELFPFNFLTFLTAADVYIPTSPPGSVQVTMSPRDGDETVVVNVPNWPSLDHRTTIQFRDHLQDWYRFTEYPRGR